MRLIDADRLKEMIKFNVGTNASSHAIMANELLRAIDNQSTAYDVNKVVAELRSEAERWRDSAKEFNDEKEYGHAHGLEDAIRIVKRGGKDD